MARRVIWAVVIITALALIGCGNLPVEPEGFGSLQITIGTNLATRTVAPDLDMTVDRYEITVTGPGSTVFRALDSASTSTVINSLLAGEWTVTVNALNADDPRVIIGNDVETVTVLANGVATANTVAVPLDGQGTLHIDMDWPIDTVTTPGVTATLTPYGGDALDISGLFVIDTSEDPHTATYSGPQDNGYYTLTLTLSDDTTPVWNWLEVTRIITDQATEANYTIAASQLGAVGDLTVNLDADLQNPLTITFSGEVDPLTEGVDMTVTAIPSATPDTYGWYLNGVEQSGQTGASITLGSTLAVGAYTLNVLVGLATPEGMILSSAGLDFQVVAP